MLTQKVWHFVLVGFVITALTFVLMKLVTQTSSPWQTVSGQGLYYKMQTGFTQMYWQWQEQGRAANILYKPENVQQSYNIAMSKQGVPLVTASREGCRSMIMWFVETNILEKQMKVSIVELQRQLFSPEDNHNTLTVSTLCKFEFANFVYLYDVKTGELRMTKVE